jgi:predicted MFS family arabinose efflux permease
MPQPPSAPPAFSERKLLFLLGAVQFINVIDFMMVMPLGPDFAVGLGIPAARLGLVAGSYTAAAAVAGLVGALFLDRFDRRRALFVAMMGLVVGTAAGGFAGGFGSMLAARVLAGAFGGPASALTLAIVADAIPPERRGKAMGAVGGAFAVASVLGVPAGLELARVGGWRLPFFAVAALGLLVAAGAIALMPPMRRHLVAGGRPAPARPLGAFLADGTVLLALASMATLMIGTFALIANLSAYLQYNLGFPRDRLGGLYMVGGLVSFFVMRAAGGVADRRGAVTVSTIGTLLALLGIGALFLPERPAVPIVVLFVTLMIANATRIVSHNALSSRVPSPAERARFMSAQSAVQHVATSAGAMGSAWILHERADHRLDGIVPLALTSMALSAVVPLLLAAVAARVRRRDAPAGVPAVGT